MFVTEDSNKRIAIRKLRGSDLFSARVGANWALRVGFEVLCDRMSGAVSEMRGRGEGPGYADLRGALLCLEFLLFIIVQR